MKHYISNVSVHRGEFLKIFRVLSNLLQFLQYIDILCMLLYGKYPGRITRAEKISSIQLHVLYTNILDTAKNNC